MYESSNFSTSLSALVILVCLFDCSHPVRCKVVSHCGFCFNFPNSSWYWVLFIGYWPFVNIFFFFLRNVYSDNFTRFKIGTFVFLLSYKLSLYILDISPLLDIWFANILSHFVGCLFTFLIVSFEAPGPIYQSFTLWLLLYCCCDTKIQSHKDFLLCFLLKVYSFNS